MAESPLLAPPPGYAPDPSCVKPGCALRVEFVVTKTDAKTQVRIYSCANHTDLFHEHVLALKYGNWQRVVFERFSMGHVLEEHLKGSQWDGMGPSKT